MPERGTFEHKLYKLAMMQHALLYQEVAEQGEQLKSLTRQVQSLSAPKQEVVMTKLQRAKTKFPKAYARVKEKAGQKVADELFAHVADEDSQKPVSASCHGSVGHNTRRKPPSSRRTDRRRHRQSPHEPG